MSTPADERNTMRHDMEWRVQRSARYHARRRRFFESMHNMAMVLNMLSASAVIAAVAAVTADYFSERALLLPALATSATSATACIK